MLRKYTARKGEVNLSKNISRIAQAKTNAGPSFEKVPAIVNTDSLQEVFNSIRQYCEKSVDQITQIQNEAKLAFEKSITIDAALLYPSTIGGTAYSALDVVTLRYPMEKKDDVVYMYHVSVSEDGDVKEMQVPVQEKGRPLVRFKSKP